LGGCAELIPAGVFLSLPARDVFPGVHGPVVVVVRPV
jgi:hypothetical protein